METKRESQNLCSLSVSLLEERKILLLHKSIINYNSSIFLSSMASTAAISAVEDYIKEHLDGASIDDVEGLVTDPITQEFIINPVFIAGRIWESDSISSLRVNAINSGRNHWVHPLTRELISVEINPLHHQPLVSAVKKIIDNPSVSASGSTPLLTFPSCFINNEGGPAALLNILQLAKSNGFEKTIGGGKRVTWFTENLSLWFDKEQGMFSM